MSRAGLQSLAPKLPNVSVRALPRDPSLHNKVPFLVLQHHTIMSAWFVRLGHALVLSPPKAGPRCYMKPMRVSLAVQTSANTKLRARDSRREGCAGNRSKVWQKDHRMFHLCRSKSFQPSKRLPFPQTNMHRPRLYPNAVAGCLRSDGVLIRKLASHSNAAFPPF